MPVEAVTSSKRDVIHDDEFFKRGKRSFANHRVAGLRGCFRSRRKCFDFREDVSLRIQEQPDGSLAGLQITDI